MIVIHIRSINSIRFAENEQYLPCRGNGFILASITECDRNGRDVIFTV